MFKKDVLYLFEYNSLTNRYERKLLGSVDLSSNGFNNSFVIDGTKDSAKYSFYSYDYQTIKPYSIVWHENTNTWWIVSKDTSQRFMSEKLSQVPHEEQENEIDVIHYLYYHDISLQGCFELLNARDLTDSGFNASYYNVGDFLTRLFKLSTFEFPVNFVYGDNTKLNISPDTKIDYLKTFENYTLASALREFLDGYNSTAKLTFNVLNSKILPNGYTQLDYIQTDGNQYIDTGINISNYITFDARFMITDNSSGELLGGLIFNPPQVGSYIFKWSLGGLDDEYFNYNNGVGQVSTNFEPLVNEVYRARSNYYTFGNIRTYWLEINGQNIWQIYESNTSSVNFTISLFAEHYQLGSSETYTNYAKIKLYELTMYDNNVLVRHYIPCRRDSDNELGLYDLVSNTFYTNQGTGSFIAGEETNIVYYLDSANLLIIPKTGDITKPIIDIDYFDDVREISTNNKTSNGEIVVSNAQNVVSVQTKTFPTSGGVKLTGTQFNFNGDTAILRLPSNVHRVNWLKMFYSIEIVATIGGDSQEFSFKYFDKDNLMDTLKAFIDGQEAYSDSDKTEVKEWLDENSGTIVDSACKASTITFYNATGYNPNTNEFIPPKGNENYHKVILTVKNESAIGGEDISISLVDKELRDNLDRTKRGIYWERGKDFISGFNFMQKESIDAYPHLPFKIADPNISNFNYTDLQAFGFKISKDFNFGALREFKTSIEIKYAPKMSIQTTYFQINYVPMSDLKVKVDNDNIGENIKLYNQSGKLTDSVAFSKLINSYSKEIQNETITRYKTFINPSEIPSVGQLVDNNGVPFVISNISLDYTLNESGVFGGNYNYYVVGEFTMSRYVATKSALTNPNTNIRDYQIPQNYNVKRKQLYRDYYELDYEQDSLSDIYYYLPLSKVFNVSNAYVGFQEHTAIIKCKYDEEIGGDDNSVPASDTWYYKLETTTYILKKEIYEVVDFKDNNIIGYSSQNIYGGFDITKVLSPNVNINTPISYVDSIGRVQGITILMATYEQLDSASVLYLTDEGQSVDSSYMLNNYPVFIPSGLYNKAASSQNYDFVIEETEYEKDAIEVPFFEYSCQINDSDNVIIGNNIFDTTEYDIFYFFMYKLVDKGVYNNDTIETELTTQELLATQGYSNSGKEMGATYDSSETYYVGDIVTYSSLLYVCKEDNVTGTWDSSKWETTDTIVNKDNVGNNDFASEGFTPVGDITVKLYFKDVNTLVIASYQQQERSYLTNEVSFNQHALFDINTIKDHDILIYRLTMKKNAKFIETNEDNQGYFEVKNDAIMILRNTENCVINENGDIEIKVNHFKVK